MEDDKRRNMENTMLLEKMPHLLSATQKSAYGVGHVMNDICSAMWFSYTLLFFHVVLEMPPTLAGILLMIGQVADAAATPIVGLFADKIGSRKLWHLVGTGLVAFSFPLIFSPCPGCVPAPSLLSGISTSAEVESWADLSVEDLWLRGLYYSVLIILFQAGWAIVQISHLALIPDLTPNQQERAELTAIRYTASMCSSVVMYVVTWLILDITAGDITGKLGPGDAFKFRDIVIIGEVLGGAFTAYFHFVLKTPQAPAEVRKQLSNQPANDTIRTKSTSAVNYRTPALYFVSLLYVASRLYQALSQVYVPLYLVETLGGQADAIAKIPLVSYVASFLASIAVKFTSSRISNKVLYLLGGILSIIACMWIGIGVGKITQDGELYTIALFMGGGNSITMVASLCFAADLIGSHTENSAFVYSVVTFADKLICGVAIVAIQILECKSQEECPNYYRQVLAGACGGCALVGLLALIALWKSTFGNRTPESQRR